jgi:hypothetical protein
MRAKRCYHCEDVDVTAQYRGEMFAVLCAPCHLDAVRADREAQAQDEHDHPPTLVWTPQEVTL